MFLLQALTKLSEIEVQLNSTDLPRNSAELADRHSQLSNVIVEVSTAAQTEGRLLLERVSRDDSGADGVRHRVCFYLHIIHIPVYYKLCITIFVKFGHHMIIADESRNLLLYKLV